MKRLLRKLNLWCIRHGVEFETGATEGGPGHGIDRFFSVAIHHRFYGIEIVLSPYKGVYSDEVGIPHATIAARPGIWT
jgi:hypothetical protein